MKTLSIVMDRRNSHGKSSGNRRKFLDRVRDSIREAMPNIINDGSLKDIGKSGGKVEIRKKTVQEPNFRFGAGGDNEHVLPGNKEYSKGDRLPKPKSGQGQGGTDGGKGDGPQEDPFVVEISREEFLNYLFEDLDLPDLVRKELSEATEPKPRTAGYSTSGSPARLAVVRSMRMANLRRVAMRGGAKSELEEVLALLGAQGLSDEDKKALEEEAAELRARLSKVPFIDPMDLRFRTTVQEEKPIVHATMVCIMDNSISMGQREKTLSRKFFYLLYLFLSRKYERIEILFISHTDTAKEVSEEEFFATRESGGTVVSSALEVMAKMIPGRLSPAKTNIYVCQCSDGDNYYDDNPRCEEYLTKFLLPHVQYWAYVQIEREGFWNDPANESRSNGLWGVYKKLAESWKNLAQRHVSGDSDIYPVFRKLFEKKRETST